MTTAKRREPFCRGGFYVLRIEPFKFPNVLTVLEERVSVPVISLIRWLKKLLLVASILLGLYVFAFFVSRSVLSSLYAGIESSRATGLSALAPAMLQRIPSYRSADNLLEPGRSSVVRALSFAMEAPSFDDVEWRVVEVTRQSGGSLEEFRVHRESDTPPWLEAKLRVPVKSLAPALAGIRGLGAVRQETQALEDTNVERDSFGSQLESKRAELSRLNEVVKRRVGSLSDTVAAEEKLAQRRKEVDELEQHLKSLSSRVEYALIQLQITEQYRAHLNWRRAIDFAELRNSAVEGACTVLASFGAALGLLLRYGFVLLVWAGLLYWPSRWVWRRYRRFQVLRAETTA